MKHPKYIAIEGVIGAGKTTLATMLAESLHARPVLEKFEENPFLEAFYAEPERYAFQTQMFFLLSRYRQLMELGQLDLFHEGIVSDYTIYKDEIFARMTLSGPEYTLYRQFSESLSTALPKPDLIVYLHSEPERLEANISKRGRPYEKHISLQYLADLQAAYTDLFHRLPQVPILFFETSRLDFVANPEHFAILRRHILEPARPGVRHLIPSDTLF